MPAITFLNPATEVQFTPTGATVADLLSVNAQAAIAEAYLKSVNLYGNQSIAGIKTFTDTTQSTTKDNGCVVLEGGLGVEKAINSGGTIKTTDTTASTSATTGSGIFGGGLGVAGKGYFGDDLILPGTSALGRLVIRGYHIWLDANGLLRYKSTAPTSDTDGTAINGFDTWTAPTLVNSFAAVASPQQSIQYRKDTAGQVQIRGAVSRATFPSNTTTIFTLPTGYRPPLHVYFVCPYISNTGEGVVRINILNDGSVVWAFPQITPASQTSLTFLFIQASFSTSS